MNDFTKEELEQIKTWAINFNSFTYSDSESKLFEKVESMIENYCEHDDLKDVGAVYKVCRLCAEQIYDE